MKRVELFFVSYRQALALTCVFEPTHPQNRTRTTNVHCVGRKAGLTNPFYSLYEFLLCELLCIIFKNLWIILLLVPLFADHLWDYPKVVSKEHFWTVSQVVLISSLLYSCSNILLYPYRSQMAFPRFYRENTGHASFV